MNLRNLRPKRLLVVAMFQIRASEWNTNKVDNYSKDFTAGVSEQGNTENSVTQNSHPTIIIIVKILIKVNNIICLVDSINYI